MTKGQSNRFIVGKDGKKQRVAISDGAHSYADARAAGKRFKLRASLPADRLALLNDLAPAEQRALLDMPQAEREQMFAQLAEVKKKTQMSADDAKQNGNTKQNGAKS